MSSYAKRMNSIDDRSSMDLVEGGCEVKKYSNCGFAMFPVGLYICNEPREVIGGAVVTAESTLTGVKQEISFKVMAQTSVDHSLHDLTCTISKRDWAIRFHSLSVSSRLDDWYNRTLEPLIWEGVTSP